MTKDDWVKMWESIKAIELEVNVIKFYETPTEWRLDFIMKEVRFIKQLIKSEIGQME